MSLNSELPRVNERTWVDKPPSSQSIMTLSHVVMVTRICDGFNVLFSSGFDMLALFRVHRLEQLPWFAQLGSSHKIEAEDDQPVPQTVVALRVDAHHEELAKAWCLSGVSRD